MHSKLLLNIAEIGAYIRIYVLPEYTNYYPDLNVMGFSVLVSFSSKKQSSVCVNS